MMSNVTPTTQAINGSSTTDQDFAQDPVPCQASSATYTVFDLLYDRFESLQTLPLRARRHRLKTVVRACANSRLVFSEGIVGPGRAFFEAVCRKGLEGAVAKRLDGHYPPGLRTWIKIKPR
jgi:bifunctional non-homologous end joining protein LigD